MTVSHGQPRSGFKGKSSALAERHHSTTEVPAQDRLFVQSVSRAMRVLDAFAGADGALTLAEIAARAGIDRSAAQRFVHTLRVLGYLRRDPSGAGFLPALRILDHAYDQLRLNPQLQRASPILIDLRRSVRERVDLSLFDGLRMVYALRMQSKRETFFTTLVGHAVPTWCTSGGWAVLACLPDAEVDELLGRAVLRPLTPRTLTDPAAIRERVADARERGHALAVEQILLGEIALGMALTDAYGRPWGAVHIAASLAEWEPEEFRQRVAPLAAEAVRAIAMSGGA